ncbi:MAG: electron transport complex protein [Actinobacteria bacterium]|nr:MAG: electron transport complex protein [Actinomycetota bacterium]MDO8948983.1 electron transport complex subunit RsxC [Actinomycetota bacterium]
MSKAAFKGGVHPPERKEATSSSATQWAPVPGRLVIPMSQHLGAPCQPVVAVGDRVVRGQVVGTVDAMVSAPVHSPVSGEVTAVGPWLTAGGTRVTSVTIVPDAEQDLDSFVPVEGDDVRTLVRAAGIVGMGGATFPSAVKLTPPKGLDVSTVILNGCECEPFLTCDHRLMLEESERVVAGARIIAETVGAKRVVIGIEANKPDAIAAMQKAAGDGVEILSLVTRYPQGAEKQLIWALLRREVPHGKLPAAAGALVHNVATAVAIADAVELHKPLMERIVTVTGRVARPGNYRVLLGTLVSDLLEMAGGIVGEPGRVIAGGPMTGPALGDLDVPIAKGSSGIVVLSPDEAAPLVDDDQPCIRCGRCTEGCPMFLQPFQIGTQANRRDWTAAEPLHPVDCIECGVCSYVCPTKRPLLQLIRLAKAAVIAKGAKL